MRKASGTFWNSLEMGYLSFRAYISLYQPEMADGKTGNKW